MPKAADRTAGFIGAAVKVLSKVFIPEFKSHFFSSTSFQ